MLSHLSQGRRRHRRHEEAQGAVRGLGRGGGRGGHGGDPEEARHRLREEGGEQGSPPVG